MIGKVLDRPTQIILTKEEGFQLLTELVNILSHSHIEAELYPLCGQLHEILSK